MSDLKIEIGKRYRMRNGGIATITGNKFLFGQMGFCGVVSGGDAHSWLPTGEFLNGYRHPFDLMAPAPDFAEVADEPQAPYDPGPAVVSHVPGYAELASVLQDAYNQSSTGKGSERHGNGKPFLEQPILEIVRMLGGTDGHAYQIMKKAQEANSMARREEFDAAEREFFGVIVYAAAAVIRLREISGQKKEV